MIHGNHQKKNEDDGWVNLNSNLYKKIHLKSTPSKSPNYFEHWQNAITAQNFANLNKKPKMWRDINDEWFPSKEM